MNDQKLATEAVENYCKAIYTLSREDCTDGCDGATQHRIAKTVGVSLSGVSKMLRSMTKLNLVEYSPYHPVKLTSLGEKVALEVIRHHRLLELYLMHSLGYGWEDVHREADRLEHHISEQMEERIEALLGFPTIDPHGDPIPTRDGHMPVVTSVTLASQPEGASLVVRRVTDEDQELLRYLAARGITPGAHLTITGREPFGGSIVFHCPAEPAREQRVSPYAAHNVFVDPVVSAPSGPAVAATREAGD